MVVLTVAIAVLANSATTTETPSDGIKVGSDDVEVAIATTTNRGLA